MKNIVIIDTSLDVMGGVERIINTLSNKLCSNNNVIVISNFKRRNEMFYSYDKKIDFSYLIDESKSFTSKKKNVIYYFRRIYEKFAEKHVTLFLKNKNKNDIYNADVLVFGRIDSFNKYAKYLLKHHIHAKIIVRDAIHLDYHDKKTKKMMRKYFPKLVNTFIVSSDESICSYNKFLGPTKINIKKIYNPLGIIPNVGYKYENKTIISLGRMDDVDQKGFKNLILAFKEVLFKHSDWKLKIYGDGPSKADLEQIISENNLKNSVELCKSTKNVVSVLNDSSIYVMASRFEGYANMLVEAMSCGVPSISYDWLMGVSDIITNNENGLIVKLKDRYKYFNGFTLDEDIQSLAHAISYLIENKKICQKISNNAEKIIDSRKTDKIISEWQKIITK